MSEKLTLDKVRQQIDSLDEQIQSLIGARARCAQQVAEIKKAEDPGATVFYRPEREAQVLQKVMARNQGPLPGEEMARLFREIMSACLALEHPMRIAFLGPAGTFTQTAALKHFGHSVQTLPLATIDEVFREVEAGAVNYGVVPVENSTEGVVTHTADTFITSTVRIIGEVEVRIHHHLLVADGTRQEAISRIYSHQQSLAQCRKWLDSHFPRAERVAVASNADAAMRIKGEWHSAAIAGERERARAAVQKKVDIRLVGSDADPRAIDMARNRGLKIGKLRLITVWPFPEKKIRQSNPRARRCGLSIIERGTNHPAPRMLEHWC